MIIILLAFICGIVLDVIWTLLVQTVQTKRAVLAATLSVLMFGLTLVSTILVVEQCIPAIIAYGIGNFIGTYFAVKRGK
jgi:multidrug transporter EmrE-like cation transporter